MKFKWKQQQGINWFYTWVYNPIAGIKYDICSWWYWRDRCAECAGDGTVDQGDYGQSWVVTCPSCGGTGKKRNSKHNNEHERG